MQQQQRLRTKTAALGGIMLALLVVTLFLASFVPGIELTLYAISSFYTAVMILETNGKGGGIFYVASGMLALLLIPNKAAVLPYLFFFGLYGIVKFYIEKIRRRPVEIFLKLVFFNISIGSGILLFKSAFLGNIQLPEYSNILLALGAQLMFLLYDYIFTLLIAFYRNRFSQRH
ncbi:MAG: hypothetical protein ACOX4J_02290 [Anaerovoracaceae bacterium]